MDNADTTMQAPTPNIQVSPQDTAQLAPHAFEHITVLLHEGVEALNLHDEQRRNGIYVDGTYGRGGHSRAILAQLGPQGKLFAFDRDPHALAHARSIQDPRFHIFHAAFADIASTLATMGITRIDGLLLDVGVSSPQLDDAQRGFSFRFEAPLDMRMDNSSGMSAADYVNTASVEQLREVIADYGEERFALSIAKAIVARRDVQRIDTTGQLADLVAKTVRTREKGQHPATRTFQALRIHINQELTQLALALEAALPLLNPQGRLAVIAFHSLEDRIVKQFINQHATLDEALSRLPLTQAQLPLPVLQKIARVYASPEQVAANPRARSAVMRVAQRTLAPLAQKAQPEGVSGQKWSKRREK